MDITTIYITQFIGLCPLYVLPFEKFVATMSNSFARKTGLTTQTFVMMTFILELLLPIVLGTVSLTFLLVDFR